MRKDHSNCPKVYRSAIEKQNQQSLIVHLDKEIIYQLFHRISLAKTWYITEAKGWSKGKRSLSHILTKQRNEFIKLDQTLVALIEANLTEIEIYQDRDLLIEGRFTNYVNSRASQASRRRSL